MQNSNASITKNLYLLQFFLGYMLQKADCNCAGAVQVLQVRNYHLL